MPSLLGNNPDPTGLISLLGSAVSGGAATPDQPAASQASFLAAANALANAGAPTFGPAPTTAQAILQALGAGRSAAIQTNILPYIQQQAQLSQAAAQQALQNEQLDYQVKAFNFQRQQDYLNLVKGGVAAGAGAGDTTAAPPPSGADIANLPDVQALPDQTRAPAIAVMTSLGMSPAEASQYARMLMTESAGLHIDPKTGGVLMNRQGSGATGVAQLMPGTFDTQAKLHNIQGSITDLIPNLTAGANYFHDQVIANGGDLRNATIAYNLGPTGLQKVLTGQETLPAETQDYLAKTRAPMSNQVNVASAGAPGPAPPPSAGAANLPVPPVPPPDVPVGNLGLVRHPDGSVGTPGGGFRGPPVAPPAPVATAAAGPAPLPVPPVPPAGATPSGAPPPGAGPFLGTTVAQPVTSPGPTPPAPAPAPARAAAAPPPAQPAGEAMVRDVLSGTMVPLSVEQAAIAAGRASMTDPMAAHAAVIADYVQKQQTIPHYQPTGTPGVQRTQFGETTAAPGGTTVEVAPTPAERKALFPNVPAWQDIILKKDQNGSIVGHEFPDMGPAPMQPVSDADAQKPVEQGGAGNAYQPGAVYWRNTRTGQIQPMPMERQAAGPQGVGPPGQPVMTPNQIAIQNQEFQQAQTLQQEITHGPLYTQWALGDQRFNAVFAGLNQGTRAGDEAALLSLAKIFDPSAVVNEGRLQVASTYGGIAQQLTNAWGKITGESGLPDDVRQQIGNLAIAEQSTRDAAVLAQINRTRANAQANGIDPLRVMPRFDATALTADSPEAQNAPAGVKFAQPKVFQNGKWVTQTATPAPATPGGSAAAPAQPASGGAGGAATPPAPSTAAPPPVSGKVSPSVLQAMPDSQFNTWIAGIKRGQYTDQELGQIIAEKRRRAAAAGG